ncbi:adenylate/guanylate cyclase domain-containing protein [Marinobacterium aestuariivivens]|uniref:Adenylate/guanylate cyclase domain-containing protein n=1 Tax=Marinobacterium aestuariivivens TaxID=1698799 RepID=A0ABW2A614_9GAMM
MLQSKTVAFAGGRVRRDIEATAMANEQQRAVLFADISGSTRLYEAVGDLRAREIVANCIGLMISACEGQGGTLIKTIGDEVMVSFEEARAAARSAIRMQEGISGALVVEGRPIQIRVGFHQGSVLLDAGDIFGDTVNLAARIAAQAKAGQVLTTGATFRILGPEWAGMVRRIDCAPVKGKREEVEIFELLWQRDDLTRMAGCEPGPRLTRPGARLRLEYRGLSIEICAQRPSLTIGRSEQNDLVVIQSWRPASMPASITTRVTSC